MAAYPTESAGASLDLDPQIDRELLENNLTASLQQTTSEVLPWFVENMPSVYFQDTDHPTQLSHLRAIIAAKASGRPIEMTLRSDDDMTWTRMRPQDYPGVLAELVADLPQDLILKAAKIHTASDGTLVLDTFVFGDPERPDASAPDQAEALKRIIDHARRDGLPYTDADLGEHFMRCTAEYLRTVSPLRFCKHLALFERLSGTDGTEVILESETDPSLCRIVVAVSNATTRRMLERIAWRLAHAKMNILSAYLDLIDDGDYGTISLLGFVVQAPSGGPIDENGELWKEVRRDLLRNKWVDNRGLQLAYRNPTIDVRDAEIITGLCDLTHQVLAKRNSYAFNLDRMLGLAERNFKYSEQIVQLFLERFDPAGPLDDDAFAARSHSLAQAIDANVDLEDSRTILRSMLDAVSAVLRTNVYVETRYALAFRLDPSFLSTEERSELPYGVFYVHGRGFNGFHVRFRDIARGGLRVVLTRSEEQHGLEAERLYDEAYSLAFAQQLKNKDIPEGGAKAAILLDPYARVDRGVKGFVDAILDLITPDEAITSQIVDRYGQDETLFLGPDENITPEFISWIVNRARQRRYPLPTAFMSSKPGAGINHKDYGVTSEGVTVFLDVALRSHGIDPDTQPFTIKMTGGPDGDVGGNLIKILHRDYGDRPHVVGIADGSGSGEDPDGLDLQELLRLQEESLPIVDFDRSKLGPNGRVSTLDDPDGVHLRNTLHFRVVADAFVPCGGRPNAIHAKNWRDYLKEDGSPSAPIIVEGANLFLTHEARQKLSDAGVMIMKDSSANKCGVITSSYEISSNMIVSEEEFLEIKERFVEEVKVKLRDLARREAKLLVRVHRHHPHVPLPVMSTRLSRVMIRAADAIEEAMDKFGEEEHEILRTLVIDHLPPVLVEKAGSRLWEKIPIRYARWIMAKSLAARIVYREGFEYLDAMPMAAIAELSLRYLRVERERRTLADSVRASNLGDKERVAQILSSDGIFSTME